MTNPTSKTERFSNGVKIDMMRATESELVQIASIYRDRLTEATIDYQIAQDYLDRRFPQELCVTQPLSILAMTETVEYMTQ